MVIDGMFANNSLIGAAMSASNLKNSVIVNNIANAEVPGFKKSTVDFETLLDRQLNKAKETGYVDLDNSKPQVRKVNQNFSYRLDGNNVDIESEMAELYKNSIKYDVMANSLINNYKRINMVLTSK